MYEAKIIGTDIVVITSDFMSAYEIARIFDRKGKISMKYIGGRWNESSTN